MKRVDEPSHEEGVLSLRDFTSHQVSLPPQPVSPRLGAQAPPPPQPVPDTQCGYRAVMLDSVNMVLFNAVTGEFIIHNVVETGVMLILEQEDDKIFVRKNRISVEAEKAKVGDAASKARTHVRKMFMQVLMMDHEGEMFLFDNEKKESFPWEARGRESRSCNNDQLQVQCFRWPRGQCGHRLFWQLRDIKSALPTKFTDRHDATWIGKNYDSWNDNFRKVFGIVDKKTPDISLRSEQSFKELMKHRKKDIPADVGANCMQEFVGSTSWVLLWLERVKTMSGDIGVKKKVPEVVNSICHEVLGDKGSCS